MSCISEIIKRPHPSELYVHVNTPPDGRGQTEAQKHPKLDLQMNATCNTISIMLSIIRTGLFIPDNTFIVVDLLDFVSGLWMDDMDNMIIRDFVGLVTISSTVMQHKFVYSGYLQNQCKVRRARVFNHITQFHQMREFPYYEFLSSSSEWKKSKTPTASLTSANFICWWRLCDQIKLIIFIQLRTTNHKFA